MTDAAYPADRSASLVGNGQHAELHHRIILNACQSHVEQVLANLGYPSTRHVSKELTGPEHSGSISVGDRDRKNTLFVPRNRPHRQGKLIDAARTESGDFPFL